MSLQPPENIFQFIYSINAESVATRYPDDIQRTLKEYSKDKALEIINNSKQAIQWLKKN
jgi:HEPN domain-containing protein